LSGADSELEQLLEVTGKVMSDHLTWDQPLDAPGRLEALRRALAESGISDLADDTFGMERALHWLSATVAEVAYASPSVAFVLAARYTAQRAAHASVNQSEVPAEVTSGAGSDLLLTSSPASARVMAPWRFNPEAVLLIDLGAGSAALASRDVLILGDEGPARIGLKDARMRSVGLAGRAGSVLDECTALGAARDWSVLTSAVSLGIAERALTAAEAYAVERRQFGSALVSFAGIRALLVDMHMRVSSVRALLDAALAPEATSTAPLTLLAAAGRTAVDVGLDAIQIHGGYGYMDEYPLAGLVRDAISMRARSSGRRSITAAIASGRFARAGTSQTTTTDRASLRSIDGRQRKT
jgi:Acyl-CoA dehydrogenase, C-terminal domain